MGIEVAALGIGALTSAGSAIGAGRAARRQRRAARQRAAELTELENTRQEIINPFEGIQDLSGMINNPFANLQVATRAAELQAEEADISLATSLDNLRATGAGAAGATALAQAALRSKQGISATIQQQEAQNARLRAQGEAQAQARRMAELQRLQQADVAGEQFQFGIREQRELQRLNRVAGLQQQAVASAQASQASMFGALGSLGGSLIGAAGSGAFSGFNNPGVSMPSPQVIPSIGTLNEAFKITNPSFNLSSVGLPGAGAYIPQTVTPRNK